MIALVLAAGFGTRFRPATLITPKPLLPFLGRPILFRLLDHLIAEGVDAFVLNTHHLADVLESTVGSSYRGCPVAWSREREILGTAGGIRGAADAGLLGHGPFLIVNGDIATSFGLGRLLKARRERHVASALAVLPNERPDVDTPLYADAEGRLIAVGGDRPSGARGPFFFTGIQAANPSLLARIPAGVSELARAVLKPSGEQRDGGFVLVPYSQPSDGTWFDLGSPERMAVAERAIDFVAAPGEISTDE
ncbi:MAG: sugar phosphate nucleotidyltransferase [Thermoanaerobaculia bacterium]